MQENGINQLKLKLYGNLIIACLCDLLGNISSEGISEFTIHFYFNEKTVTPVNSRVSACAETVCCIIRLSGQFHFRLERNGVARALLKPASVGKGGNLTSQLVHSKCLVRFYKHDCTKHQIHSFILDHCYNKQIKAASRTQHLKGRKHRERSHRIWKHSNACLQLTYCLLYHHDFWTPKDAKSSSKAHREVVNNIRNLNGKEILKRKKQTYQI